MNGILLKNGLLTNMETGKIYKSDILIENSKVKEISDSIQCDTNGLNVRDLKEAYVLPGLIDCHTHLGIIEEATGKIGVDNNETSEPVTPYLRAIDAVNPMDISFGDAVRAGITCVMSGPGSNNVVGGQSIAIKTHGDIIDKMVVRNPVGFKIALGENPISTYGKDSKCPVTRMGIAGLIRELFMKAQDYMEQQKNGKIMNRDFKLEAVIPLLNGEIPLRAHAHRADDIVTAIRIAEEFGIKKLVIEHGTEANLIKDYLKEKNVFVAFGPMLTPRIKMELKKRHYRSICELVEAGIRVAMITDHPFNSIDQLSVVAALGAAEGLSTVDALRCITTRPAEILECENRIGCIDKNFDADIAVFDGPPLDVNSKVLLTIINGEIVYEKNSI